MVKTNKIAAPAKTTKVLKSVSINSYNTPLKSVEKNTYFPSHDSSSDESDDFLSPDSVVVKGKKIDYDFSSHEETDLGSPIFAQSQDILTSLGQKPRNSAELFSPMSESSFEN